MLQLLATDSADMPQDVLAAIMADVERFAGERPADDLRTVQDPDRVHGALVFAGFAVHQFAPPVDQPNGILF